MTRVDGHLPAIDDRFVRFDGLDRQPLLLAVSGGPDSMALMALAATWRDDLRASRRPSPPLIHVATVDHGLRLAARAEAQHVAAAAARFGLPHTILTWAGPKPKTRLQEKAREARYALLSAQARDIGATHVLTAHHADDQAETLLIRLARGSGVTGLAGMRRESSLAPGLTLVRPLLDLTKADLVAVCRRDGLAFVEDPSNADPAYARARLRGQAAARAALGLDTPTLVRLARRMAEADDALEAEADRLEGLIAPIRAAGRYQANLTPARQAEGVILSRILARAIDHANPGAGWPRLDRLETLTRALRAALASAEPHRATLGGTRIVLARDGTIDVVAESPRRRGRPPETQEGLPRPD
jgi:tRNA(Ile)-lysidine synthase